MSAADNDAMWQMVNDPVCQDLTATTAMFSYEQIREWCASRQVQDVRLDLAIVENATGEVIGEAVLNEYDEFDDAANFRISLRGPKWFGRGFGTEATRLLVQHGLNEVGLSQIHLEVLSRNMRAIRAYERVGFRTAGVREEDGEVWISMEVGSAAGRSSTPDA